MFRKLQVRCEQVTDESVQLARVDEQVARKLRASCQKMYVEWGPKNAFFHTWIERKLPHPSMFDVPYPFMLSA